MHTRVRGTGLLSWPPSSWTACMNRAWSAVVHRIRGARTLLFEPPPGTDTLLPAARLNAHPCCVGCRWLWRAASADVPSPRLRPGGSAPELGFARNPTSPLPSAEFGSPLCCDLTAADGSEDAAAEGTAGGLIRRERFGRFLCNIARDTIKLKLWKDQASYNSVIQWKSAKKPVSYYCLDQMICTCCTRREPWIEEELIYSRGEVIEEEEERR